MLSDEELENVVTAFNKDGHLRAPHTLRLIAEVRRLRELVEMATDFIVGDWKVYTQEGKWTVFHWPGTAEEAFCRAMSPVAHFQARDEAIAYARERSGR